MSIVCQFDTLRMCIEIRTIITDIDAIILFIQSVPCSHEHFGFSICDSFQHPADLRIILDPSTKYRMIPHKIRIVLKRTAFICDHIRNYIFNKDTKFSKYRSKHFFNLQILKYLLNDHKSTYF